MRFLSWFNAVPAIGAAILMCVLPQARADEPTAFALVKEGDRYVGEQSRDKVVEIHSDKSVGTVVPNIWYIVYYDPTATFKAVEVKFAAGKMIDVKRPLRMLEPITGDQNPLDFSKLTIDSDKALKIALAEPILEKLTVKASSLKLARGEGGLPVWKVRIWAAKLHNPNDLANLGEVTVTADDGKVIKNDLKISRVD